MKSTTKRNRSYYVILLVLALLAASVITVVAVKRTLEYPVVELIAHPTNVDFNGTYEVSSPYCSDTVHLIEIAPMGTGSWHWISNFDGSDTARVFCEIVENTLQIPLQALIMDGQEVMISGGGYRSGEAIDLFYEFQPSEHEYVHECHLSGRQLESRSLYADNSRSNQ